MDREHHSSAVIGGEVQHLSVSSIERADIRAGGCLRKWWYRYVAHIQDVVSKSQSAGIALHAELADYLRTGNKMLSALAMRGLFMVPEPGADLLVEQSIGSSYLFAAGIPLKGYIDCAHDRGTNKGGQDIEAANDPTGTVEVIDWKWKRDGAKEEFFIQPNELHRNTQMAGYGIFISKAFPSTSYVRLSHGYFPATRGLPRKVTKLHVLDDCARTWEYVDSVGRTVRDVAREIDPEHVPGNRFSCDKYGGCQHRPYCSAYKAGIAATSTASLFGDAMSKEITMGLMNTLPLELRQQVTQPQQPQQPQQDMRQQLAQEEAQ